MCKSLKACNDEEEIVNRMSEMNGSVIFCGKKGTQCKRLSESHLKFMGKLV